MKQPRRHDGKFGPSYTVERGEQFCARIAEGESVEAAALALGIPKRSIYAWLAHEREFRASYEIAMKLKATVQFEELLEISANPLSIELPQSGEFEVRASDLINAARLRVDALKWGLARTHPERFGDLTRLTGKDGGALEAVTMTAEERAAQKAAEEAESKRLAIRCVRAGVW